MARYLTQQAGISAGEEKALHALGADRKKTYIRHGKEFYLPYRNYFSAPPGGDKDLEEMRAAGYVTGREVAGIFSGVWYGVTDAGLEYLSKVTGCHIYPDEE